MKIVDIYLTENKSTQIQIPILPESIKYSAGEQKFFEYDILRKGTVAIPATVGLKAYGWSSFFPGEKRYFAEGDELLRGEQKPPKHYHEQLKQWMDEGTPLTLTITGYPINTSVYIKKYSGEMSGAFGDMNYEIELVKKHSLSVNTVKKSTKTTSTNNRSDTKKTSGTTYTIKKGDTLYRIAVKYYKDGTKWPKIYNANKSVIEAAAKKHGKKGSSNGAQIYAGTVLKIP